MGGFVPNEEVFSRLLIACRSRVTNVTHSDNKAWLAFDAPVHVVESLLYTEYFEYHDSVSGGMLPACDAYHVPKSIQHHVDYITPGVKLMASTTVAGDGRSAAGSKKRSRGSSARRPVRLTQRPQSTRHPLPNPSTDLDICDKEITPACLAALYKYPPGKLNLVLPSPPAPYCSLRD